MVGLPSPKSSSLAPATAPRSPAISTLWQYILLLPRQYIILQDLEQFFKNLDISLEKKQFLYVCIHYYLIICYDVQC